jgi:translation elongation factor EF-1alpha
MKEKKVSKKRCGCCAPCKPIKKVKNKAKIKPKKTLSKSSAKSIKPEGKLIGEVTHYFAHVKVGVINLTKPLTIGDEIRIVGGNDTDFNQEVKSMEEEHVKLTTAKSGHSIGLKVKKHVREGYKVYKV